MRRSMPVRHRASVRTVLATMVGGAVLAAAAVGGVAAPASAASTTPVDQWGDRGGDAGNSGTNAGEQVLTAADASRLAKAWSSDVGSDVEPPIVLGGVAYSVTGGVTATLVASSPKTGALLWSTALPGSSIDYAYGAAGSGTTVLVSQRSNTAGITGGVVAVSTASHSVIWTAHFPQPTAAAKADGEDGSYPGVPITDGTRVYVAGSSNAVNAYSLSTGAPLWTIPYTYRTGGIVTGGAGIAAGGGYVYTGGALGESTAGLNAYSASTGKLAWTSRSTAADGIPVLAGGRVFVEDAAGVAAYAAAGCGASSCGTTWTSPISSTGAFGIAVSAADASHVYVTSESELAKAPACGRQEVDTITRLSATTGARQWTVNAGGDATLALAHAGDVLWMIDEYWAVNAKGMCAESDRILAYSDVATSTKPIATVPLGADYGVPSALAVASGTVFFQTIDGLLGYRAAGS